MMDAASLDSTMRNIVQQLQQDPKRYRCFGVYWWPIKLLLKRHGYGPENLYLLGSYQDPTTAALVPRAGLTETIEAAMLEYGQNLRFPHPEGMVEDPDGELVRIWDEDAGF
jgi:hypothetical protein